MSFKDKINESMHKKIAFTLAEGLKHDRYMRSHRQKAKNIEATWAFTTKKDGWPEDNEMVMISGKKLNDAAKEAMVQLKAKDVYVMEASEELEEKINKFLEGQSEFAYAAAQAKKDGKKEFKFAGKTWPVTIKTDIPEEVELDEDAKTLTANRPHRQGKVQYKQDNEKNQKQAIKDAEASRFAEAADPDTVAMIKDNPKMKDQILRGLNAKARKEVEAALKEGLEEGQKLFMFKTKSEAEQKAKEIKGKVVELSPKHFAAMTKDLTVVNEKVDLDEGTMMDAAKELEAYARKSGGIDKDDFMKAVAMMKKQDAKGLVKFTNDLDTEPRDKIIDVAKNHIGKTQAEKLFGVSIREELDEKKTDVYHQHMLKALGKTKLPKNHGYTSAIATNGDFVVHDGGGRVIGRIKKDDHDLDEGIFKAIGVAAKKVGKAVKSVATQKGRNDRKQAKIDRLRNKAKEINRAKALKRDVKQAKADVRSARREDVTEASFETPSNEKKLAELGRRMMDMAQKEKNDMISNAMANLGDLLTKYGTLYGPKNMKDLEKKSGMKQAIIIDLMKRANKK